MVSEGYPTYVPHPRATGPEVESLAIRSFRRGFGPLGLLFLKAMIPEMGRAFSHSKPSGVLVEHNAFHFDRGKQGSLRGLCRYLWKKVMQKGR